MPPKKRKTDLQNGGTERAAKHVKTDLILGWDLEEKREKWSAYSTTSDGIDKEITSAYNSGLHTVSLELGGDLVVLDFSKMTQKNKSGWEKRIRCCVNEGTQYFVWQWQGQRNKWSPFSVYETIVLETAYRTQQTNASISEEKVADISNMELTDNGTSKPMQRLLTDHRFTMSSSLSVKVVQQRLQAVPSSGDHAGKQAKSQAPPSRVKKEKEAAPKTKSSSSTKSTMANSNNLEKVSTVVKKGRACIDPECHEKAKTSHVYSEGNNVYDAWLNQTNLANNNNKYYIIQLLEEDKRKSYCVWMRWGRVGKLGQHSLVECGPDLEDAKDIFMKKFADKTKNDWADRNHFVKVAGKYDLLMKDYAANDVAEEADSAASGPKAKKPKLESQLDSKVQDLISMICNVQEMEEAVLEMKYDSRRAPLGKLTSDQIKAGYTALKQIEHCLTNNLYGSQLTQACDAFYTRIPHDFGMSRPPVIRTMKELKEKLLLLEALGDIQVALKVITENQSTEHPLDNHYRSLGCQLSPMARGHPDFQIISNYLQNSHASTHNQYTMDILEVFEVQKEREKKNYKDLGNRMLLWHGSRLTNWFGILNKGLCIAPPEAPVTGYMFGKGVYFADMSSKSANYCFATRTKNCGLILLSEVSLGNVHQLYAADCQAHKLPPNKHSVQGMGKLAPDPSHNRSLSDGTIVPLGQGKETGVTNPDGGYTLNYNEYIVYNTQQIKMRYLIKIKFNFV